MKTKEIALAGVIAALYIALVYAFQAISFGPIQIRIANILDVCVAFSWVLFLGRIIGTVIANLITPYNIVWESGILPIWFGITILGSYFILKRLTNKYPKYVKTFYFAQLAITIISISSYVATMLRVSIGVPFLPVFSSILVSQVITMSLSHFIIAPILKKLGFKLFQG